MDFNKEESRMMSVRARHITRTPNLLYEHIKMYVAGDPYDPETNPQGVVNMGSGENMLCQDLLMERMTAPDMDVLTSDMLYYAQQTGVQTFREAICKFFTRYLKPAEPLDPDMMMITSGAGAALDMLANFIADPGDCVLCPAPHYGNLTFDFSSRQQVELVKVFLPFETFVEDPNGGKICEIIELFDKTYLQAVSQGKSVKGIILVNPNNPLGYVMKLDLLMEILLFAKRYSLHVMVDEVYCQTVFDPDTPITSVLQLPGIPDKERTHVIWSFSKDLNLNGFRCGVLYGWNNDLLNFADHILGLAMTPAVVQRKLQNLISDFDWLDMFFKTNIARIRGRYKYCIEQLAALDIQYIEAKAGYFIWADYSQWLREPTMKAEKELLEEMVAHKVRIVPGYIQGNRRPGWFRITFVLPMTWLEQGFANMAAFLSEKREERRLYISETRMHNLRDPDAHLYLF